jgi:hypothetical protein
MRAQLHVLAYLNDVTLHRTAAALDNQWGTWSSPRDSRSRPRPRGGERHDAPPSLTRQELKTCRDARAIGTGLNEWIRRVPCSVVPAWMGRRASALWSGPEVRRGERPGTFRRQRGPVPRSSRSPRPWHGSSSQPSRTTASCRSPRQPSRTKARRPRSMRTPVLGLPRPHGPPPHRRQTARFACRHLGCLCVALWRAVVRLSAGSQAWLSGVADRCSAKGGGRWVDPSQGFPVS